MPTARPLPIRAAAWVLALGVCCPALADDDGLATLEPVLAAIARQRGLAIAVRDDDTAEDIAAYFTSSTWVAIARDPARIEALRRVDPAREWRPAGQAAKRVWTDDHASILSQVRWGSLLGNH